MTTPRKRIMRKFTISELSAVDRPAQVHARSVLMKRADDDERRAPAMLRNVKLVELSLVDRPANPHARVTLVKRADDKENDDMDMNSIASFNSFESAVAAIAKREGLPAHECMSRIAARRPDLVEKLNAAGVDIAKRAAEAARPPAIKKAVLDFEDRVDEIAKRDGVTKVEAMRTARGPAPE